MVTARVLIADDEPTTRQGLSRRLSGLGHEVDLAADGLQACERLREVSYTCVITALKMPGADGLEVLREAKRLDSQTPVIVMTAYPNVDAAVTVMQSGAFHYLEKSVAVAEIESVLERALEERNSVEGEGGAEGKGRLAGAAESRGRMAGRDDSMEAVFDLIGRVALSDTTILVMGESGTGKELVARAIHEASERRSRPMVPVNCAAIPEGLLESELFGHVKGAFTGAHKARDGRFKLADGGTIFLDEIGEMPALLQSKLLRVLQEREFEAVGGTRTTRVDVRVIAATNRELEEMVEEGSFREDLYYRLSVIPVQLPPLRERGEDVLLLLDHFLERFSERAQRLVPRIPRQVADRLCAYPWPGNVRELENLAERLVVLVQGDEVSLDDIPPKYLRSAVAGISGPSPARVNQLPEKGLNLKEYLSTVENDLVDQALGRTDGNRNKAAQLLGLNRTTLVEKLKKRGL